MPAYLHWLQGQQRIVLKYACLPTLAAGLAADCVKVRLLNYKRNTDLHQRKLSVQVNNNNNIIIIININISNSNNNKA